MAKLKVEVLVGLVDKLTAPLARLQRNIQRTGAQFAMLGAGASYGGRQILAPLQNAARASMDLESAMADVRKVVDFETPEGLAILQRQLESLSTQIPLTAAELASIAAAGGQLGIQAPMLPDYTETVAKAATAFDMLPDEAGLAMAKLANVYTIPIPEISLLGDAINHLSNNAAASAPEIIDAVTRASNAASFGLAAEQTAAYSAAMIALGESPERAGTALNFMLQRLQSASRQTPKFTAALAEIGYTGEELERQIAEGPNQALMTLLETLGRLDAQSRTGILTDLVGAEHSAKIGKLVGNLDETQRIMALVGDQSEYAGSMQTEFANRADTTANRMQLLANRLDMLKRSIGSALLPAIEALSQRVTPWLDKLGDWIERNRELAGGLAIAAGAIGAIGIVVGPILMGISVLMGALSLLIGTAGFAAGATAKLTGAIGWLGPVATKAAAGVRGLGAALLALKAGGIAGVVGKATKHIRGMALALSMTKAAGLSRVLFIVRALGAALLALPISWVGVAIAGAALLIYKFWGPISGFFSGLWQGIVDGLRPVREAFAAAWSGLAPVIEPVAGAVARVSSALGPVVDWLGRLIAPMQGADQAARSLGQTLGYWLVAPWRLIADGVERVATAAGALTGLWQEVAAAFDVSFVDGITAAAQKLNPIAVLVTTMRSALPELWSLITATANRIIALFKSILSPSALLQVGADLLRGLGRGIASAVGGVVESVKAAAGKVIAAAKSKLGIQSPSTVFAAIGVDLVAGLQRGLLGIDAVPGWLSGKLAALTSILPERFVPSVKAALELDHAPALQSARQVSESMQGAADNSVASWGAASGGMIQSLGRFVAAAGELPSRMATVMQALLAEIRRVLSPTALFNVGLELFRGLASGIRAAVAGVVETVRSAAGGVIKTAKGALGVQSPSWIFAEIGSNLVAGLKQGLGQVTQLPDWLATQLVALTRITPRPLPAALLMGAAAASPASAIPMPAALSEGVASVVAQPAQPSWTPPRDHLATDRQPSAVRIEMPITINVTAAPTMDQYALADVIEQRMRAAAGEVARHLSAIYDDPDEV